ncbi:hypothetical protein VHEMI02094 [[Torrubiella] hemipterigena]|uniref:Uncharacterized protein n=1 Tax=[Torrubiella] hemipterigena TaxID=1531966 RepID=A0A0A1T751_9HYPO|nr:hypothetical protein VHEMI02094 [[Torrubiella] hemipterigena]
MSYAQPLAMQAPQIPSWATAVAEDEDLEDEPPEIQHTASQQFKRTPIRRPAVTSSLLTKAIQNQSDDDDAELRHHTMLNAQRRRSMTSNVSLASTADLTSDTGLTSPSRTNTPSPPVPDMLMMRLNGEASTKVDTAIKEPASAPRKRCIQFACATPAQPQPPSSRSLHDDGTMQPNQTSEQPRRPCIRFACPSKPASTQNTPPRAKQATQGHPQQPNASSPSTPKKLSALSTLHSPSRPTTARRLSNKTANLRPQFLRANSKDLVKDSSQFHEFASGMTREEDWIRSEEPEARRKLTINDTLTKEINFRRLADEADEEEAAEMEEDEDRDDEDDEDDEGDEEEEDDDENDDDEDEDDEDNDDYDSDGYHTDEETGFADSDEEDDDALSLWTPSQRTVLARSSSVGDAMHTAPDDLQSDSSAAAGSIIRIKPRRIRQQEETPDLPDSTDFVCGTLDEDRPLEEAYMSCLAARRNEKLRIIPQDIDPSFPTSDPENDDDDDYRPSQQGSDENVVGEMEDLHHGQDRSRRRRKSEGGSPRRLHSPPPRRRSPVPKRRMSPAPQRRCRSPVRLFDSRSPTRMRSPTHHGLTTPTQSPRQGATVKFHLAGRPAMQTKSLPRPSAMLSNMKHRSHKHSRDSNHHIRGAIDIVKGLEKKRQRRSEKFYQKYCNRARRGQLPERKPQPGRGAERMKELGLLMAGKKEQGNYVLSI